MIQQFKTAPNDKIELLYDERHDILYIEISPPTGATSEPIIEGIYLRREVKTEKIASVIIERYSKRDKNMLIDLLPIKLDKEMLPS
jgi:hypothetical protein